MKKLYAICLGLCLVGCQSNPPSQPPLVVDATRYSGSSQGYSNNQRQGQSFVAPDVTYSQPYNQQQTALEQTSQSSSFGAEKSSENSYTVVKGDTLYSIAFRYGQDFRSLASLNGIEAPYQIEVGQRLNLRANSSQSVAKPKDTASVYVVKAGDSARSIARNHNLTLDELVSANNLKRPYNVYVGQKLYVQGGSVSSVPVAGGVQASVYSAPVKVVSGKTRTVAGISWMWPAEGIIIKRYSSSEQGNNGIDIAGDRGQAVCAAADGQVVYAGNALRGYGNLIIINHKNEYLSAYAHNESLGVKEGQKVKRGQVIAKMGSTDSQRVKLHFEIRKKGDSVNPENYLPK